MVADCMAASARTAPKAAGKDCLEIVQITEAEKPIKGHVGMWTKADSVTCFDELIIEADGSVRNISW